MLRNKILVRCFKVMLIFTITRSAFCDVPRPRGVSLMNASLYYPRDEKWVCLDGSKTINFLQINDDYCDCADGSDEPGTAACPEGTFHCDNRGYRYKYIPSSRVNDGICDCCDASDEYGYPDTQCVNTCAALGRAEQELRKRAAEIHRQGSAKRSEMITKGKQLRAEREKRRSDLEVQRQQQETLRNEKEEIKKQAEHAENEAIDLFKELQREKESDFSTTEASLRKDATENFLRYDVNKDDFVDIVELQLDIALDQDRNGVVTVEEAKYFLDERDRVDLQAFITLSWPRIKPMQMLSQGIFKPPVDMNPEVEEKTEEKHSHTYEETKSPEFNEDTEQESEYETEEEADAEAAYEEDEPNVGVGSVTEVNTPAPEYDPETQRFIDLANEARNAYADAERELRDIDQELNELKTQIAKDYGPQDEYSTLEGECFKFEDREYVYTLCPFDRTSQQPIAGGTETTLGRWDQWVTDGKDQYAQQKYSRGASCWNGPQRSAIVQFKCALESKITAVSEPNRCEYHFDFETPSACDEETFMATEKRLRDEL
uniref:Glucosidase 2 subunit beta n=1 Tax=Glossina palpalis gambiensis TaxID=67801 RepID=A0A1B0C033_9MUSC